LTRPRCKNPRCRQRETLETAPFCTTCWALIPKDVRDQVVGARVDSNRGVFDRALTQAQENLSGSTAAAADPR
jgi:hypothetical protein